MPSIVATIEMPGRFAKAIALTGFCAVLAGCSQNAAEQSTTSSGSRVSASSPPTTSPIPLHAASYSTALEAGIAGVQAFMGAPYLGSACPTGGRCFGIGKVFGNTAPETNAAAYVRFAWGSTTEGCFAYVFYESGGWHYMPPSGCPAMPGGYPVLGEFDHVKGTGSCANVRREPSLSSKVVACLKDGQVVLIDQDFPRYVDKHIWWSIDGHRGWMAHDFLIFQ